MPTAVERRAASVLRSLLCRGGRVAWGVLGVDEHASPDVAAGRLAAAVARCGAEGEQSLLTASCGTGRQTACRETHIARVLARVRTRCRAPSSVMCGAFLARGYGVPMRGHAGEVGRRGRPPRTSVDSVVDAALELGLSGLTLAAVAERLGVRSPSLYTYVDGLPDLLRRAADRLIGSLVVAVDGFADPAAFAIDCALQLRKLLVVCPGLARVHAEIASGAMLRHEEAVAAGLVVRGLDPAVATLVADDVVTYTVAYRQGEEAVEPVTILAQEQALAVEQPVRAAGRHEQGRLDPDVLFEWLARAHVRGVLAAVAAGDLPWNVRRPSDRARDGAV